MIRARTVVVAAAVAITIVLVIGTMLVTVLGSWWSDGARTRLEAGLAARLDAEVVLDQLDVHVFPRLRAEGRGLTIRHRGRRDVPPLLSIAHFSAEGSITNLLRKHVSSLDIDGLDIEIPPDRNRNEDDAHDTRSQEPVRDLPEGLVIDRLVSRSARLAITSDEPDHPPKVWSIHSLQMSSVSVDRTMPFEAVLTNAVPPGEIRTSGTFGPWRRDEPGRTALNGTFTFDNADLSVFKGISGVLSAHGQFGGLLERIDIRGETETPDFQVKTGEHSLALHTRYHAIVDGTNGNTRLERVDASFLNTALVAKGSVIDEPGKPGRTVSLDVSIERGRLEDVLALAIKSPTAPMTGALQLTTTLVLPPGDQDVVRKLQLNGHFSISRTRFTTLDVQRKVNELSQRGSGKMAQPTNGQVMSRFVGVFKLANSRLVIPRVTFDVPGSLVRLGGTYDLLPEQLNFKGTLFMDVKVSETTTGLKRMLLKIVDPFFNRPGGGSAIPIRIVGARNDPDFGLDRSRVFSNADRTR